MDTITVTYKDKNGNTLTQYGVPNGTLAEDFLATHNGDYVMYVHMDADPPQEY